MKANKNVCSLRCPWSPSWLLSGFVTGCTIFGRFGAPPSLASVDYTDPRLHNFQGRTSKLVKVKLTPLQGPECNAGTRSRQCLCSENQLGNPLSKNCSFRDKHQCLLNEIHWPKVFYLACTCGFYLKKNLKTTNRWKMWTPTGVFVLNKDEDALTDLSLWKTAAFSILVLSCKALLWTRSRTWFKEFFPSLLTRRSAARFICWITQRQLYKQARGGAELCPSTFSWQQQRFLFQPDRSPLPTSSPQHHGAKAGWQEVNEVLWERALPFISSS